MVLLLTTRPVQAALPSAKAKPASAQKASASTTSPAMDASAQGKATLTQSETALSTAKNISLTCTVSVTEPGRVPDAPVTVRCILQRPDSIAADLSQNGKEIGKIVSGPDGGYVFDAVNNHYIKVDKADSPGATLKNTLPVVQTVMPRNVALGLFLTTTFLMAKHPLLMEKQSLLLKNPAGAPVTLQVRSHAVVLNGAQVQHVTQTVAWGPNSITMHVYVNSKTKLPVRVAYTSSNSGGPSDVLQMDFSSFALDGAVPNSTFQYTPPATALPAAYTPPASRKRR
jgi:outer membrane lipoprotein-sorting protein